MSLNNKLKSLRDVYAGVTGLNVYHYWREQKVYPCLIWAEDSEGESLSAGNKKAEQVIHGTSDLFTQKEYDPFVDSIQEAMNSSGIAYRLNSVQYEDDTNLIHYEWEWEIS